MTEHQSRPSSNGPRPPREDPAERLHEMILDVEDTLSRLEGATSAAAVIAAVLMQETIQCRGIAKALWFASAECEDLVGRLQEWHAEALLLARATVRREQRP